MRYRIFSCCLVAAMACGATTPADEPAAPPPAPARLADGVPQYVFQIGLYRLKQPADGDAEGIRHFPERDPVASALVHGGPHAFGSLNCDQCHAVSWPNAAGAGSRKSFADRVIGQALSDSVAEVIAEPVLATVSGRPAHLLMQGGVVEYFVRDGDGRFRLEKTKDESGVEVRLNVVDAVQENDSERVTVDPFTIRITTLDQREAVKGVSLPVGKPVYRTFEWDATLTCRPGQINAFTLDSPRQGRILAVVRLEMPGARDVAASASETAAAEGVYAGATD